METLNNFQREIEAKRERINRKQFLRLFYEAMYQYYKQCIERAPQKGMLVEIGSGAGFAKSLIPQLVTTDVYSHKFADQQLDATKMSLQDSSVSCFLLLNCFHHIPNVRSFFSEAIRCLVPNGRILIIDPYPGLLSVPLLKYLHNEVFDLRQKDWTFASSDPLVHANNALAWIVFKRDRKIFEESFPMLKIELLEEHSPLRYWLSGGLTRFSVLPGCAFGGATILDKILVKLSARFGSFVKIEIRKVG